MGHLGDVPATEGVYALPLVTSQRRGALLSPRSLRKEKGMRRTRVMVLLAATTMSVAMLAMASMAGAQQPQQPEETTSATEDGTTTTTTTAEPDSSTDDSTSTAANRDDLKIKPISPKPGSETRDRTPLIKAKVTQDNNNDNNKLNKRDITLYVDGDKEGDFTYRSGKGLLEFTPENNLSFGKHTVKVVVKGGQGQKEREKWSFRVEES
jgi:hypothetical protein